MRLDAIAGNLRGMNRTGKRIASLVFHDTVRKKAQACLGLFYFTRTKPKTPRISIG